MCENNVMVYALSQKGAVQVVTFTYLVKGVQYNLSNKKEPYREICGALRSSGITISL